MRPKFSTNGAQFVAEGDDDKNPSKKVSLSVTRARRYLWKPVSSRYVIGTERFFAQWPSPALGRGYDNALRFDTEGSSEETSLVSCRQRESIGLERRFRSE